MNESTATLHVDATSERGTERAGCPFEPNRDDRKSAALVARSLKVEPGIERTGDYAFARELLRNAKFKQDGPGADQVDVGNPEHVPVFYLDGELHHKRRTAIVKFFGQKSIDTRYLAVMESTTERLVRGLQTTGRGKLDEISFELTTSVVAEIIGLGDSDMHKLSKRLSTLLRWAVRARAGLRGLLGKLITAFYGMQFMFFDVLPAVRSRRKERREDIISQTLDKGYSLKAIMIECMTYATAGMVTTREFIVMVAWHLFDKPALLQQFLGGDAEVQLAILQEILRLEPIAAMVFRRADDHVATARGQVSAQSRFAIDLRGINTDEALVGPCAFALDPERAKKQKQNGTYMSFGDGPHRCPGWQVALEESRVFLDRLMRVPGIRLERAPDMLWNAPLMGYELRDAIVTCDRVAG